jgi:hypothetical protein
MVSAGRGSEGFVLGILRWLLSTHSFSFVFLRSA